MIYSAILTQIQLIVSLAEIIVVYSIFLFDDFRNNIFRGSKYIYYIYIKYLTSYFGLRTRELKEGKRKEILKTIY